MSKIGRDNGSAVGYLDADFQSWERRAWVRQHYGYESTAWGKQYPKIQLLTVADLLAGKQIDMPPIRQVNATFKKAPKAEAVQGAEQKLGL